MKKKIVIFGPYPPPFGGIATFMEDFYKCISLSVENLTVLAYSRGKIQDNKIVQLVGKPWYLFQIGMRLYSAKMCFDMSEFCFEYPNWKLALYWWIIKRVYQFKWIHMVHSGSLPARFEGFTVMQKKVFNLLLNRIDQLIVVSDTLAEWFKNTMNYKGNISVIGPLLPEMDRGSIEPFIPDEINRFIANHRINIVAIGIFDELYGFYYVATTIEKIRNELKVDIGLNLNRWCCY